MKTMSKVALATALLFGLSGLTFAQDGWGWHRYDNDHDRDDGYYRQSADRDDGRWYRQGVRDGRDDREDGRGYHIRNRHWDERDDRQAYERGYREGYNGGYGYQGGYDNRGGYYPNGGYNGGYGRNGYNNQAYQVGYQDGLRHGQSDRSTGHSYRPTHDDDWHHADRGYNSAYGNKQLYKDTYRQGYQSGYDRGYNQYGR